MRPMAMISLLLLIIMGAQSAKIGSGGAGAGAGAGSGSVVEEAVEGGGYRPAVMQQQQQQVIGIGIGIERKLLAPFEVCLVCKCCVNATTCVNMPCCFGIDCQLPNKPFGFCAFVPKICNCATCTTTSP